MPSWSATASWALVSKAEGEDDYQIKEASDGETPFGGYAGHYVAGTPDSSVVQDALGAPPWITFGPIGKGTEMLLSISIQDWWEGADSQGRHIWPTRLFLLKYNDTAQAGASYQQLWRQLARQWLPANPPEPVRLQLPGPPIQEIAETIERFGREFMAATAATLLYSKIALSEADHLSRDERVAVLDALLALLPYGLRRSMSASTAVDNTVPHGMDLVFADFPARKQQLVSVGPGAGLPELPSEHALAYYRALLEKMDSNGVPEVVSHLWQSRELFSLREPGRCLVLVREINFDNALLQRLASGEVTWTELDQFFRRPTSQVTGVWRRIPQPQQQNVLAGLLESADRPPIAPAVLVPHWKVIEPAVVLLTTRQLHEGHEQVPWHGLKLAALAGSDDELLSEFIRAGRADPPAGSRLFAALTALLTELGPPATGRFPHTLHQVQAEPDASWPYGLFRDLLLGLLQNEQRQLAVSWAAWLCGETTTAALPGWVTDLLIACSGRDASGTAGPVPRFWDPGWAAVVLGLASVCGQLPLVLSLADRNLYANMAGSSAADMDPVLAVLDRDLWDDTVPANSIAIVDSMRILQGEVPAGFPLNRGEKDFRGYLGGLDYILDPKCTPHEQWRTVLENGLLARAAPPAQEARLAPGGVMLLNSWSAEPARQASVIRHIKSMAEDARPLHDDLAAGYWKLLADVPELASYAVRHALATAAKKAVREGPRAFRRWTGSEGVVSSELALACYQARLKGPTAVQVIKVLAGAGITQFGPEPLDDMLRDLINLEQYGPLAGLAQTDLFACYEYIYSGELGPQFTVAFRRYLDSKMAREITVRRHVQKMPRRVRPRRKRLCRWLRRQLQRIPRPRRSGPAQLEPGKDRRDGQVAPAQAEETGP